MRWVITLSSAVALVARGIHLGRPITVPHAAVATLLLLGAYAAHVLSWSPLASR